MSTENTLVPLFKSFEEACKINGDDPKEILGTIKVPERFQSWLENCLKTAYMTETANAKELPNYDDTDQDKMENWGWLNGNGPAGFGFAYTITSTFHTDTNAGVRLVHLHDDYAEHARENWEEWRNMMLGK